MHFVILQDAVSVATTVIYVVPNCAGSHLIDQALCLFGPPSKVTGLITNQRHLPVCSIHDAFTVTLQYDRPEGLLTVLLRSSSLCKIPGPRLTVHGTQVRPFPNSAHVLGPKLELAFSWLAAHVGCMLQCASSVAQAAYSLVRRKSIGFRSCAALKLLCCALCLPCLHGRRAVG